MPIPKKTAAVLCISNILKILNGKTLFYYWFNFLSKNLVFFSFFAHHHFQLLEAQGFFFRASKYCFASALNINELLISL